MTLIANREFTVSDGNAILCAGEVRYTFTVTAVTAVTADQAEVLKLKGMI